METSSLYNYADRLNIPYEQKLRRITIITCLIAVASFYALCCIVVAHSQAAVEKANRLSGIGMAPRGSIPSDQWLKSARSCLKPLIICGLISLIISLTSAYFLHKQRPIAELQQLYSDSNRVPLG